MKLLKTRGDTALKKLMQAAVLSAIILFTAIGGAHATDALMPADIEQNEMKVQGKVVDYLNEPLIGVSVSVRGTSIQTITDLDGNYSLTVPSGSTKVVFTYIGFKETVLDAKPTLDVTLKEDSKILSEVVVVGYGTMKKENLTGAVVSVDLDKAIGSRPIADVGRGLQGIAPGLQVTLPNTEIGSDPIMKIRGNVGSIQGKSAPLILLDNVEIPSIQMVNPDDIATISILKDAASASIYGSKASFGVILITTKKGSSVEKVNVQYSNNFGWQTVDKTIRLAGIEGLEYAMETQERRKQGTFIGAFFKVSRESIERSKEWMQNYGGKIGMNDPMVYGRDWYRQGGYNYGVRIYNPADYMVKDWAFSQTHNLSIGGTTGKTTYNVSLGYLNQNSMLKPARKDDFVRYNGSVRVSSEINKYLTIRAGTLYSNRNKRSPFTGTYANDPWYYMYRWTPVMPYGVDEYGDDLRTPANEMAEGHTSERENSYTSVNFGGTFNITSNWDIVGDYTYSRNDATLTQPGTRFTAKDMYVAPVERIDGFGNRVYANQHGEIVPNDITNPMVSPVHDFITNQYSGAAVNKYYRNSEASKNGVINIYSTYNLKLGKEDIHNFKFMAGTNRVIQETRSHFVDLRDVLIPEDPQIAQTLGAQFGGGSATWEAQIGYFGRVNYSYDNKYLLEANIRHDGSSKFPTGKKWRSFPSFSLGWIATQEKFMEPVKPVLEFMKVRASWGSIGDQSMSSGLYLPLMPKSELTWIGGDGNKAITFGAPDFVQRDLMWQKIETLNVGLDMRLWGDRIGVTADWYQRKTKDMITSGVTLPKIVGALSPKGNYAELTTKGWELTVDFQHRFSNGLTIRGGASVWDSKSVYTDFYDDEQKSIWGFYKGKTFGEIWGYKTDRLYQMDDFVFNNPDDPNNKYLDESAFETITINAPDKPQYHGKKVYRLKDSNGAYQLHMESAEFKFGPGDVKYQDLNGDGFIDAGTSSIDDHGDMEIIGNSSPRYEYSFNVGAEYKGFDISVLAQGIGKRQLWGMGQLAIPGFQIGDGGMPDAMATDYWQHDRTDAFYPRPWNMFSNETGYNMQRQSKYLLDMSYLRIKNVTLGYSLNPKLLEKLFISKARVYMSLENLFTFDNLRGLPIDPEAILGTSEGHSIFTEGTTSTYNAGRVGNTAPAFKTISFGMQVTF